MIFSGHTMHLKPIISNSRYYNRLGQLVCQFSQIGWINANGKLNGIEQPAGIYVWFLRYTHRMIAGQKIFQKGTVMLIK